MRLCTSGNVREWCEEAKRGIIENKAVLVSRHHVEKKLEDARGNPEYNIVRANVGVSMIMNSFALVLKEGPFNSEVQRQLVPSQWQELPVV